MRGPLSGTVEVRFDGYAAWSFDADAGPGEEQRLEWPANMRRFLAGTSRVTLALGDLTLDAGEVVFTDGGGRVEFVDEHGVGVVIDKWGIIQRPFHLRGENVLAHMTQAAARMVEVAREECGVQAWLAFGSLLGAAREGGAIAHDADIDLAYLSDEETPARMARELYDVARALRRHGFQVTTKSGSFITVHLPAEDGPPASIDLYTTFHLGGLLHETATVRAPVPREAVLPVREIEFEGRMLPAPADPDALLTVSYGPGWRTPDPGFRHRPGPEITDRFDDWFGSLMRERRFWEVYWRDTAPALRADDDGADDADAAAHPAVEHARWAHGLVAPDASVVVAGSGDGREVLELARLGHAVEGVDYARGAGRRAARIAEAEGLEVRFSPVNFYDLRDAVSAGVVLAGRRPAPRLLLAPHLLDALGPEGRATFWPFATHLLRGGGTLALVFHEVLAPLGPPWPRFHRNAGRVFAVSPAEVTGALERAGARVETSECGPDLPAADGLPPRRTWRVVARG